MARFEVHFQGWFQCRLATDPDPFDEPRGVSGWTFAVSGEPDLDRVIRFEDPVALREFVGLQPGVRVTGVMGFRRDHAIRLSVARSTCLISLGSKAETA